MKLPGYDELLSSMQRLSLILFLIFNAVTASFFLFAINGVFSLTTATPLVIVIIASVILLLRIHIRASGTLLRLKSQALLAGLLWAWYIYVKKQHPLLPGDYHLLLALVSILLISAITLRDRPLAFYLYTIPPSVTALVTSYGHPMASMLFIIALPLIGFILHHLILRRRDRSVHRLVSQLYAERETYSDLSMLDPLTGLYNRRGLKNRLDNVLAMHAGSHFVLLLDIDNFKAFNDNYGHAMGDQTLMRVSFAIRGALRTRDIVTRYGGEEFLVLLTNVNESVALKMAERIRLCVQSLEIPHRFNERVCAHVTVSVGVAPLIDDDFDSALANADRALYLAKDQGRNIVYSSLKITDGEPLTVSVQ